MNIQQKNEIIEATNAYMTAQKMTAADMNRLSGVSQAYLSAMLNGKHSVGADGGKQTDIADKWYYKLADVVGVRVEKEYWKTIVTRQMRQIITEMGQAKKLGHMSTIICNTGLGKTYVMERFVNENPKHTYIFTVNSLVRLHDVVNGLTQALGLEMKGSKALKMARIVMKLRDIKRSGGQPVIILDEAENMEHSLLKMIKGLFDGVVGYASLILIGTDQLEANMLRAKNQNMQGGPQFYSRFKASIKKISAVVDFTPFFEEFVEDKGLRKLLDRMCDDYRQLNQYLEPAMRECDARGVELNEMEFRRIYGIV